MIKNTKKLESIKLCLVGITEYLTNRIYKINFDDKLMENWLTKQLTFIMI